MKKVILAIFILGFSFSAFSQNATQQQNQKQQKDEFTGIWKPRDGNSMIQIYKKDNLYYGKIVWLKYSQDEKGNPIMDVKNEDKKMRENQLLATHVIEGFSLKDENTLYNGRLYSPETGLHYKNAEIKVSKENLIIYVNIDGKKTKLSWKKSK